MKGPRYCPCCRDWVQPNTRRPGRCLRCAHQTSSERYKCDCLQCVPLFPWVRDAQGVQKQAEPAAPKSEGGGS